MSRRSAPVEGLDIEIKLKSDAYQEIFDRLSSKELENISKRATKAAAQVILSETKKELKKHTNKSKSTFTNAKHGWNLIKSKKTGQVIGVKSLEQGIRMKYHKDEAMTKINIMGDMRLKWMEKGTEQRYTKETKAYRGSMPDWWFFRDAINNKRSEAYDRMQKIIELNLEARMKGE